MSVVTFTSSWCVGAAGGDTGGAAAGGGGAGRFLRGGLCGRPTVLVVLVFAVTWDCEMSEELWEDAGRVARGGSGTAVDW